MQNITFKIIKVILIVGTLFGATNAFSDNNNTSELGSTSNQIKLAAGQKTAEAVDFLNGQFSTIKPVGWSIRDDLNDEADLQMGNLSKEAYSIVLSESKIDYDDYYPLEKYSEVTRGFLIEGVSNPSISELENLVINDHPAIKTEIIGAIDGIKIRYWHVSIETETHFHQLVFWSFPSYFEKNKADYEAVINSFDANF